VLGHEANRPIRKPACSSNRTLKGEGILEARRVRGRCLGAPTGGEQSRERFRNVTRSRFVILVTRIVGCLSGVGGSLFCAGWSNEKTDPLMKYFSQMCW